MLLFQKNLGQLHESLTMNRSQQIVKCGHLHPPFLAFKSNRRQLRLQSLPRETDDDDHALYMIWQTWCTATTDTQQAYACYLSEVITYVWANMPHMQGACINAMYEP